MKAFYFLALFVILASSISFRDVKKSFENQFQMVEKKRQLQCGNGLDCLPKGDQCSSNVCDACSTQLNNCFPDFSDQSTPIQEIWNTTVECFINASKCYDADAFCNSNQVDMRDNCISIRDQLLAFGIYNYPCDFYNGPNVSTKPKFCNFAYRCDSTTNKCEDKLGVGQACTDDEECGDSSLALFEAFNSGFSCKNNVCVQEGTRNANDLCSSPSQCAGGMACTNGRCVGLAVGQSCNMTDSEPTVCSWDNYCDKTTKLCTARIARGNACTPAGSSDFDPCANNDVCYYPENTCGETFKKAANAACQLSDECEAGLYCAIPVNTTAGTCQTQITSIIRGCSNDTDCPTGYKCSCDFLDGGSLCEIIEEPIDVGDGLSSKCAQYINPFLTCLNQGQCSGIFGNYSCSQQQCPSLTQCVIGCFIDNPLFQRFNGSACYPPLTNQPITCNYVAPTTPPGNSTVSPTNNSTQVPTTPGATTPAPSATSAGGTTPDPTPTTSSGAKISQQFAILFFIFVIALL